MWLDYIISSPLATITVIELVLALILNALLFYIVYKHTPTRMKDYRIILLNMAVTQFFIAHTGIGALPEYLYPFVALRINGYFKFVGPTYGAHFTFIQEAYFICSSGFRVLECSVYRFYSLKHQKFHLRPKLYLLFHFVLSLGFVALFAVVCKFFLQDKQELIEYANFHNYSTEGINFEEDVLLIGNVTSLSFYAIGFGMAGVILSGAAIIYLLNLMTHRHMKQYISRSQISSINYQQQHRLTWLLVGQGSLPLLIAALGAAFLSICLPDLMTTHTLPKLYWEMTMATVFLYPLLGPILTIVLTKPYYDVFKLMLMCRQKEKRNRSATIIKL